MANGESTKVRFDLWLVLVFLVAMGVSSSVFLYGEGRETKTKQAEVISRVVTLEAQQKAILEGIGELKQGQKELTAALLAQERAMRIKRWNQIP